MSLYPVALALLLIAGAVAPARAAERSPTTAGPVVPLDAEPPQRVWYGWQVLAIDATSLLARRLCRDWSRTDDGCDLTLAGYAVGSPLVHTLHRGWPRGIASLAIRVALPVAAAWYWSPGARCRDSTNEGITLCGAEEEGLGLFIGFSAAILIDTIWAFDEAEPPPRPATRASSLTPTLTFTGNVTGIGLSGRF
jgi:hypothetical protein